MLAFVEVLFDLQLRQLWVVRVLHIRRHLYPSTRVCHHSIQRVLLAYCGLGMRLPPLVPEDHCVYSWS